MRETFRVLFFIRKNQLKDNGLATIMIRITINGKQIQFSSKLEIDRTAWSQKENKAIEDPFLYINELLEEIRSKIKVLYFDLSSKHQVISPSMLKQAYLGNGDEMLLSYQLKSKSKYSVLKTAEAYRMSQQTVTSLPITVSPSLCLRNIRKKV